MSADRLREAARVLRERAEAATPGPWEARVISCHPWVALYDDDEKIPEGESLPSFEVGGSATAFDCTYIATMHPGVGLALADWLEWTSVVMDNDANFGPVHIEKATAVADRILGTTA